MSNIYHTTIINKKLVARDTLEILIKRPSNYAFKAGQYTQLGVQQLLYPDPKGATRIMSIASSPLDQDSICVAFRKTDSGYKRTLEEIPTGTPLVIDEPHGYFTFPERSPLPVIFIAGGIGITPFLSMIRYSTAKKLTIPITLLYSNSNQSSAAYIDELKDMSIQNSNFTFKNLFGRIDDRFIKQNTNNFEASIWYIAGPQAMIDHVRNTLFIMGVNDSHICIEEFTGY